MRQERSEFRAFLYYRVSPSWGLEMGRAYLKIKLEREGYGCSRIVESLLVSGKPKYCESKTQPTTTTKLTTANPPGKTKNHNSRAVSGERENQTGLTQYFVSSRMPLIGNAPFFYIYTIIHNIHEDGKNDVC